MAWLLLLTLVCMLTYTVEIVFGLAGTILMITFLSFAFETKILVIYSVLPQILVAAIGLLRSPKTVQFDFLLRMLAFAAGGAVLGLYLFKRFDEASFHKALALAITVFGVYLVLAPGRLRLRHWIKRVLDVAAGTSQALFGICGPIAMTRLLGSFDDKVVVRNYALAFFLALNLFRTAGYLADGSFTPQIVDMMLVSALPLTLTLWYSNHLHFKINETVFRRTVAWIILLGGLALIHDAFSR